MTSLKTMTSREIPLTLRNHCPAHRKREEGKNCHHGHHQRMTTTKNLSIISKDSMSPSQSCAKPERVAMHGERCSHMKDYRGSQTFHTLPTKSQGGPILRFEVCLKISVMRLGSRRIYTEGYH